MSTWRLLLSTIVAALPSFSEKIVSMRRGGSHYRDLCLLGVQHYGG
jgi:hypothetical protein